MTLPPIVKSLLLLFFLYLLNRLRRLLPPGFEDFFFSAPGYCPPEYYPPARPTITPLGFPEDEEALSEAIIEAVDRLINSGADLGIAFASAVGTLVVYVAVGLVAWFCHDIAFPPDPDPRKRWRTSSKWKRKPGETDPDDRPWDSLSPEEQASEWRRYYDRSKFLRRQRRLGGSLYKEEPMVPDELYEKMQRVQIEEIEMKKRVAKMMAELKQRILTEEKELMKEDLAATRATFKEKVYPFMKPHIMQPSNELDPFHPFDRWYMDITAPKPKGGEDFVQFRDVNIFDAEQRLGRSTFNAYRINAEDHPYFDLAMGKVDNAYDSAMRWDDLKNQETPPSSPPPEELAAPSEPTSLWSRIYRFFFGESTGEGSAQPPAGRGGPTGSPADSTPPGGESTTSKAEVTSIRDVGARGRLPQPEEIREIYQREFMRRAEAALSHAKEGETVVEIDMSDKVSDDRQREPRKDPPLMSGTGAFNLTPDTSPIVSREPSPPSSPPPEPASDSLWDAIRRFFGFSPSEPPAPPKPPAPPEEEWEWVEVDDGPRINRGKQEEGEPSPPPPRRVRVKKNP